MADCASRARRLNVICTDKFEIVSLTSAITHRHDQGHQRIGAVDTLAHVHMPDHFYDQIWSLQDGEVLTNCLTHQITAT